MKNPFEYFIVERGQKDDPDPEKAGRVGVRNMSAHGPGVKTEHLPFSQTIKSSGLDFNRPPNPGQIMVGMIPVGAKETGYAHLFGALTGIHSDGPTGEGKGDRLPFLEKAKNTPTGMNLPPKVTTATEANRSGIEKVVKNIEEKGEQFKQKHLQDLPSNNSLFAMAGLRNTPLKNITTALDAAQNALSASKLSGLLTKAFSLNSLLSELVSKAGELGLDKGIANAMQNFSLNSIEEIVTAQPSQGAMFGNQANPIKLVANAVDLLKNVKTKGELFDFLNNIQSSDFIANTIDVTDMIEIDVDGLFGSIKQKINALGEIENVADDVIEGLQKAAQELINGIEGAGPAKKFFEDVGTPLKEIFDRIDDPAIAKKLQETVEKVSNDKNIAKLKARIQNNTNGKGPIATAIYEAKAHIARDGLSIPFVPK